MRWLMRYLKRTFRKGSKKGFVGVEEQRRKFYCE